MYGVKASIGADATWRFRFEAPDPIPAATTFKLRLTGFSNAGTGDAKVNPKWVAVDRTGVDWDAESLLAETTQNRTCIGGDAYFGKELRVTMDAATPPTAGQIYLLDLVFETAGWTLAQNSGWLVEPIWE
jgi:hypothetical protein